MTNDNGNPRGSYNPTVAAKSLRNQYRRRALQRIEHQRQDPRCFPRAPRDIRRPCSPRPRLPYISPLFPSHNQVTKRNRPEEVRNDNE